MPHSKPIHYANAGPEVRAVYDEIKATRGVDDINNWKHVANPHLLCNTPGRALRRPWRQGRWIPCSRRWFSWRSAPATGASIAYAATRTLLKKGMTDEMLGELMSVVNVATQSNILANGYQMPLDDDLKD